LIPLLELCLEQESEQVSVLLLGLLLGLESVLG
jgi:hypothetical protein